MKKLYNTLTQTFLPTYPRADDEPVVGLDPSLQIYDVIDESQPEITSTQYLTRTETADHEAQTLTLGWRVHERQTQPVVVPFRSLAFALLEAGLYEQVKAAALSTPQGEIWWNTAQNSTVSHNHPFVAALATAVGQTPEQIDAIFAAAASAQF